MVLTYGVPKLQCLINGGKKEVIKGLKLVSKNISISVNYGCYIRMLLMVKSNDIIAWLGDMFKANYAKDPLLLTL